VVAQRRGGGIEENNGVAPVAQEDGGGAEENNDA
jgi:hypothetical protein